MRACVRACVCVFEQLSNYSLPCYCDTGLYGLALPSATNQSQGAGGEDARQRGSAVIARTAIKNIYITSKNHENPKLNKQHLFYLHERTSNLLINLRRTTQQSATFYCATISPNHSPSFTLSPPPESSESPPEKLLSRIRTAFK
jgi:hypothetical protein